MERLLREIATIHAGYSFRGTIPISKSGNYRVIQIKDVDYDGLISSSELVRAEVDSIKPGYLTAVGDVIFTSRGANRRAAVVDEAAANAIFVSQLYAIKIKSDDATAEYVAWYINQKPAQEFFEQHASGSYIQNIRHDVLAGLPVILPTIEMQKKIVEMFRLCMRERELAKTVLKKRQQIIKIALLALIEQQK